MQKRDHSLFSKRISTIISCTTRVARYLDKTDGISCSTPHCCSRWCSTDSQTVVDVITQIFIRCMVASSGLLLLRLQSNLNSDTHEMAASQQSCNYICLNQGCVDFAGKINGIASKYGKANSKKLNSGAIKANSSRICLIIYNNYA